MDAFLKVVRALSDADRLRVVKLLQFTSLGLAELAGHVDGFGPRLQQKVAWWQEKLSATAGAGQKAVLWGSGSKGVAFLSTLGAEGLLE